MNKIVNGVANDYEFDMPMYYEPKSKTSKLDETQIFTRWIDPTIKEKDKEIERLNNIIQTVGNCILKDISVLKSRNVSTEEIIQRLEAMLIILDRESE